MTKPIIPNPITPEQLNAWVKELGIDKGVACVWIGKDHTYWSKFLKGNKEMTLSELNILLKNFKIRAEALG